MGVFSVEPVLGHKEAHAVAVFLLDTSLGRRIVQTFALHYVGYTLVKRSDHTHVQHVPPAGQKRLRASAHYDYLPGSYRPLYRLASSFVVGPRVDGKLTGQSASGHGRLDGAQAVKHARHQ